MEKDRIVVFIINYRGKRFLKDLVEKLKNDRFDVVVFNNDSYDDVADIKDMCEIIQNRRNYSFSQSVNKIFDIANERNYRYIGIFNNDTLPITSMYNRILSELKKGYWAVSPIIVWYNMPDIVQSIGTSITVDGRIEDRYCGYLLDDIYKLPGWKFEDIYALSFAGVFFDMEKIRNYNMDESFVSYFEDVDFFLNMNLPKLKVCKECVLSHYGSYSFANSRRKIYFTTINRLRVFLKHFHFSIFFEYHKWIKKVVLKKYLIKKYPLMFIKLILHSYLIYFKYLFLRLIGRIKPSLPPVESLPPIKITHYYNVKDPFYNKIFSSNMPVLALPEGIIFYKNRLKIIKNGQFFMNCNKIQLNLYGNGVLEINGKEIFVFQDKKVVIESNKISYKPIEGEVYIKDALCLQ